MMMAREPKRSGGMGKKRKLGIKTIFGKNKGKGKKKTALEMQHYH